MPRYKKYTDDDIVRFVSESFSIAGLLKKLGLRPVGGNYHNIKKHLQRLGVDTSHWTGQAWKKDARLKAWDAYAKASSLKPHLVKLRGHRCENPPCGVSEWFGEPVMLEIDHVNGDRTDNSEENLKLLCPNCHAQTPTWRGRKNRAKP